MRIGIYASLVAQPPGYESTVSGHVQLPLFTARLLREGGHDPELITTKVPDGYGIPEALLGDVPVHEVRDGIARTGSGPGDRSFRYDPIGFRKQVSQLRSLAAERRLDVLHLFGFRKTAFLAAAVRGLGAGRPTVLTLPTFAAPQRARRVDSAVLSRLDAVVTATDYAARELASVGVAAQIVRHGIVRDLASDLKGASSMRHRILFWRDLSWANGADVALAAYDRIASRYPQYSFDLAVRPFHDEIAGVREVIHRHPNVQLHRFPYGDELDLATLVAESLCIVLPFRRTTIDPQFAIAESLAAGCPVVATDVASIPELITSGHNGHLVPAGDAGAVGDAIELIVENRERALEMGRAARRTQCRLWNWNSYVEELTRIYRTAASSRQ